MTVRDDLLDALVYAMMAAQGCNQDGKRPVASKGIDEKTGLVNVYELLPRPGDSITIINLGSHFEIRHQHYESPPLILTDADIENLKQGRIVWN